MAKEGDSARQGYFLQKHIRELQVSIFIVMIFFSLFIFKESFTVLEKVYEARQYLVFLTAFYSAHNLSLRLCILLASVEVWTFYAPVTYDWLPTMHTFPLRCCFH